jgi:S-adenosylmethionine-diacylglycerol 3-amino-3-carboxypropyl transferase
MPADWVVAATALPVAFAQVREDPRVDLAIVHAVGRPARVMMVASGGCTLARLAADPAVAAIHAVDANPAQLALARLKVALLATAPALRRRLLGRSPMDPELRRRQLAMWLDGLGLGREALGPPEQVARLGADRAGRYEACFQALARALGDVCDDLLACTDPRRQAAMAAPGAPLGRAIDSAIEAVFDHANLVALFGVAATRDPAQPFAAHFAARLRACLAAQPAAGNPFVWQFLADADPPGGGADWLELPASGAAAAITWQPGTMTEALAGDDEAWDVVHLSNILDWQAPDEAARTLRLAREALAPGGMVVLRQLNSRLDPTALDTGLAWDPALAARLHAADRSFFYTRLHIGRSA